MGTVDFWANLWADVWHMITAYWHGHHIVIIGVEVLLVWIGLSFVFCFMIPALRLRRELSRAIVALNGINQRLDGNIVDLEEIEAKAMSAPGLSRLWREYTKTLHPQREDADNGRSRIVRWRATALADKFFSEQAIVDTRLKTEFYKHVPGILTASGSSVRSPA